MTHQLTNDILNAALESLMSKRHQIDEQIAEVRRMVANGRNGRRSTSEPVVRKHRISHAGRRAIAAAQRRRWAEQKAAAGTSTAKGKKPKRVLSRAGRAAIVAALKKRWAAKRRKGVKTGQAAKNARAKAA